MSQSIDEPHGWTRTQAGGERFWWWCSGCETHHQYVTKLGEGEGVPCWDFSGDKSKPTFKPSLLVRYYEDPEDPNKVTGRCHVYVTDGMVKHLNDCTCGLAGQTVPLEPARW